MQLKTIVLSSLAALILGAQAGHADVLPSDLPQGTYHFTPQSNLQTPSAVEFKTSTFKLRNWECNRTPAHSSFSCSRHFKNPTLSEPEHSKLLNFVQGTDLVLSRNPTVAADGSTGSWDIAQSIRYGQLFDDDYKLAVSGLDGATGLGAVRTRDAYIEFVLGNSSSLNYQDTWTYKTATDSTVVVTFTADLFE